MKYKKPKPFVPSREIVMNVAKELSKYLSKTLCIKIDDNTVVRGHK